MHRVRIDHKKITPGIYKNSSAGITTVWDVRIKHPNGGEYLSPEVIHTIEHTMSDFLRNRYGNYRIVGVFPMGSQTGFYVVTKFFTRRGINEAIIDYIMTLQRLATVPGRSEEYCGQFKLHDLPGAKKEMLRYYDKQLRFSHIAYDYDD